jgi:hypothetical protein
MNTILQRPQTRARRRRASRRVNRWPGEVWTAWRWKRCSCTSRRRKPHNSELLTTVFGRSAGFLTRLQQLAMFCASGG